MSLLPELLLTVLFGAQASFTHPGIILPSKELLGDSELKAIIKRTQKSRDAREVLGFSPRIWEALTETLRAGNDQLAANKYNLVPRVRDLVILGRNLLATKEKAQNYASDEGFEAEVRRLLDICVDKASKPIAANIDKQAHEAEMHIKGNYKKVMITTLQFLNNLMSQNETRKLHVWLHMFGTPAASAPLNPVVQAKASQKPKGKNSPANRPSPGSGVGIAGSGALGTTQSHKETVAKCSFLSAGFNAKYYKPGFLTEVPRLLQPDEIQPLPMMLQNGVAPLEGTDRAMQAVRCKLMLAQGYGRSLLREILVFLGAWEVDEDDLCFKMMTQVTEAILLNGLIPYAFESFRDEKDIVTPAQSVLLKLLASVYRQPETGRDHNTNSSTHSLSISAPSILSESLTSPASDFSEAFDPPPIIESSIPTFFVAVLRKQVIPPTIRIIKLQGAIREGKAKKETFELSLWDLDRVYEGLYQFLELLGIVGDLVIFLKELDKAIPRWVASKSIPQPPSSSPPSPAVKEAGKEESDKVLKVNEAYRVERPFDVCPDDNCADGSGDENEGADGEEPNDDRGLSEPEEFTWPHIKRYLVMLLSSFSWQDKAVQDLVREKGGLQAVLNQCMIDDDNPYIREHAILCIRNLLENNSENQKVVKELEAVQAIPDEVLDRHGYEHYIDDAGRVQLRKVKGKGFSSK
ncbi:unnamed protein product [Tuber melanosporum]|uniref:Ataxin-10 homolog n=1 Tax=Tuber melanosporum (strain Mel28) TaxID=656061 RepID=D5G822_TUBMM|nr:uncharacterized protein GSTUM_00002718001 [Tuber melanosporum]CAZ80665.1 unnamed protein product [Tuber melanosporum]